MNISSSSAQVVVHDDEQEARAAVAAGSVMYENSPAYRRIMAIGGADSPAAAAIVGDEASVEAQLRALLDAGATDIHAHIVPAGDDIRGSLKRTRDLLRELARRAPRHGQGGPRALTRRPGHRDVRLGRSHVPQPLRVLVMVTPVSFAAGLYFSLECH